MTCRLPHEELTIWADDGDWLGHTVRVEMGGDAVVDFRLTLLLP